MTLLELEQPLELQRHLPKNIDAEQLVLGSIVNFNDNLSRVADILRPEHFAEPVHSKLYEIITSIIEKDKLVDHVTLKSYLEQHDIINSVGGIDYILQIANRSSSSIINISEYAKLIYDHYVKRQLTNLGQDVVNDAYDSNNLKTGLEQIENAEASLYNLSQSANFNFTGYIDFKSALSRTINLISHAENNSRSIIGISTGITDLDNSLAGLQKSDLLILAARPSMGKTAISLNIAYNASKYLYRLWTEEVERGETLDKMPKSVGFFSLEMSVEQLTSRIISMETEIQSEKLRSGNVGEEEFYKIVSKVKEMNKYPFLIDDTPALTISALRAGARRLKRKKNLGLLVVDYLQLLRGSDRNDANRVNEIGEITQGLKAIAKELNIPVLALSQLSRAVETREDKRPQLSDLRESGSIEQDSDVVIFIYREAYYLERKKPNVTEKEKEMEWAKKFEPVRNTAELIIAKQRNGPIGTVSIFYDTKYSKVSDLAK